MRQDRMDDRSSPSRLVVLWELSKSCFHIANDLVDTQTQEKEMGFLPCYCAQEP